jgi:aspartate 1-decarboxylase
MRWYLHSKIHQATVTEADIDYIGSITIDEKLIEAAGLELGEKVLVVSNTSGARLETYVIPGKRGSGVIGMNGAAGHLIPPGDEVIIMAFELSSEPVTATRIRVDEKNRFLEYL